MKIELFGPPRLCIDGEDIQHPSRKAMALLAYLAMRAGEPVTRQHLADLLWGNSGADQARINLRQCLVQLRHLLGEDGASALRSTNEQLTLDPVAFDIPARDLLTTVAEDAAVMAAAGPAFLEGFSVGAREFENWAAAQRHLLECRLADTLETVGSARLANGDAAAAARDLSLALKLDPLRESAHRALMRAQADLGKTAAALAQFEQCRSVLKSQLGVEPEIETRQLASKIRVSRLQGEQERVPAFRRFADDAAVIVFREEEGRPRRLHQQSRGTASDALQGALDAFRGERNFKSVRCVAVPDSGHPDRDRSHAQTVLALHEGPGFLVHPSVYRLFENWSPFCFSPGEQSDDYHLLLGEMPRHRLQITPTASRPRHRPATGTSLVVLPFRDHSPDAGRLDLGEVISEEIIARLARFRHLLVVGPSAGLTCRALDLSAEQIHERLGVTYAVDGSIARIGDRLVITFSIVDVKENRVIHADRFEGRFEDLFAQQSVMVDRIASTLFNRTEQAEIDRLSLRMTGDIGAYELYLSGLSLHRRGGISTQNAYDAVRQFDSAIAIDPEFVRARAFKICASSWFKPEVLDSDFAEIDRLIALDANDPEVHRIAGALNSMSGETDVAVAHIDRAVELNPSDAYLLANAAVYRAYAGDGTGALRLIERANQVDPFLPAWCVEDHGVVLYASGSYEQAVETLRRLSVPSPRALAYLAASLVGQNDMSGASRAIERLRRVSPDYSIMQTIRFAHFSDKDTRDRLRSHLNQAGLV